MDGSPGPEKRRYEISGFKSSEWRAPSVKMPLEELVHAGYKIDPETRFERLYEGTYQ